MRLLDIFQQRLGFTRNEVKVILFLTGTFLLGLSVRWYTSTPHVPAAAAQFDYAETDREFLERSKKLAELSVAEVRTKPASQNPNATKPPIPPSSININVATKEQLMQLPGIGEAYAERIILYREDHGPFSSTEDLIKVKGIGPRTLDRLRPYVTLR